MSSDLENQFTEQLENLKYVETNVVLDISQVPNDNLNQSIQNLSKYLWTYYYIEINKIDINYMDLTMRVYFMLNIS